MEETKTCKIATIYACKNALTHFPKNIHKNTHFIHFTIITYFVASTKDQQEESWWTSPNSSAKWWQRKFVSRAGHIHKKDFARTRSYKFYVKIFNLWTASFAAFQRIFIYSLWNTILSAQPAKCASNQDNKPTFSPLVLNVYFAMISGIGYRRKIVKNDDCSVFSIFHSGRPRPRGNCARGRASARILATSWRRNWTNN